MAARMGFEREVMEGMVFLLDRREEYLFDLVVERRVPIEFALDLVKSPESEMKRKLHALYERNQIPIQTMRKFMRVMQCRLDQGGKRLLPERRRGRYASDSALHAYQCVRRGQRLVVERARSYKDLIHAAREAFALLLEDNSFIVLLRGERLDAIPECLIRSDDEQVAGADRDACAESALPSCNDDAVSSLFEGHGVASGVHAVLRKVMPMRRLKIAVLMSASGTFSRRYAEALVLGTPRDQLMMRPRRRKEISRAQIEEMRAEMALLERDFMAVRPLYAEGMLRFILLQKYICCILARPLVSEFLSEVYPSLSGRLKEIAASNWRLLCDDGAA